MTDHETSSLLSNARSFQYETNLMKLKKCGLTITFNENYLGHFSRTFNFGNYIFPPACCICNVISSPLTLISQPTDRHPQNNKWCNVRGSLQPPKFRPTLKADGGGRMVDSEFYIVPKG